MGCALGIRGERNMKSGSPEERTSLADTDAGMIMNYFRSHLQQIVALHTAMFEKLLFDSNNEVPFELAEVFEDTGNTYLGISETISQLYLQRRKSKIEEHLNPNIKTARRRVEAKSRAKPRIRGSEHLAQPIKDKSDRT